MMDRIPLSVKTKTMIKEPEFKGLNVSDFWEAFLDYQANETKKVAEEKKWEHIKDSYVNYLLVILVVFNL